MDAAEGEVTESVRLLWLEVEGAGEKPRTLVCADCQGGRLLGSGDRVLYESGGALFAAPLLRLPGGALARPRDREARERLQGTCKRIGLALVGIEVEAGGVLPSAHDAAAVGDLMGKLALRLDDPKPVQGFQYVFPGGSLDEVKNSAETVMGYLPGPGGRVVLYADTHVRWEPVGGEPRGPAAPRPTPRP